MRSKEACLVRMREERKTNDSEEGENLRAETGRKTQDRAG